MQNSSIALVFPGQGSQKAGMGRDFYERSSIGKSTYQEASEALGFDVVSLCFEENDRLNLTEYSQPCILATEIAMLRVIQDLYGFQPHYFGGHSLGEYTALVAAGVLSFTDALRVVRERGRLMQKAAPVGMGGMAAIIADGIKREEVAEVLSELPVDIANINSKKQIVISGEIKGLTNAQADFTRYFGEQRSFRFVPLTVSAPFHSRFMKGIREPFADTLREIESNINPDRAFFVTSNFTGGFHENNREKIIEHLIAQLTGTVKWIDNMHALSSVSQKIFEIGPGRPLRDFFKTIEISCTSITTLSAASRVFEAEKD
ncbi:MAG: ACP S-malonyltransferase [Syntrophales bacterium]|jgi:[acyl-carrier-protein] S-malonyltransferase/trans-AT polyketide synthase/acyltransferase/oxidoreductase domain-containing protein|nr:ACP S-malonyltransferase [Syntrophales bacterium]MDY0045413.1 ACP S-malonyltransferase [Syntrophales bacterium]